MNRRRPPSLRLRLSSFILPPSAFLTGMSVQHVLVAALAAVGLVSVVGAVAGSPVHMGIVLAGMTNVACFGSALVLSRLVWPQASGTERLVSVGLFALGLVMLSALVLGVAGLVVWVEHNTRETRGLVADLCSRGFPLVLVDRYLEAWTSIPSCRTTRLSDTS